MIFRKSNPKTKNGKKFKQDLEQYKEEDMKEALRKGKTLISYTETWANVKQEHQY